MKITKEQILQSEVRLITLNEPFASLMAFHNKDETRNRDTKVRGLVCIHSAKVPFGAGKVFEISGQDQYDIINKKEIDYCNMGKILSIGYLVGTKCMGDFIANSGAVDLIQNKTYVKYSPDLWIWEFEDMTPIEPIPFKGSQGWTILKPLEKQLINPL